MAAFFKRLFGSLGKKELRLLILGNDATGKTSILYLLKLGELVTTIPTIGFNVESLEFPGVDFSATCWDIGGCDRIRPLWRHYFQNTAGIVYVVDSIDRERFGGTSAQDITAAGGLLLLTQESELAGLPILLLANKQDLPGAMTPAEIEEGLPLREIAERTGCAYKVVGCSIMSREGFEPVIEGMKWLIRTATNAPAPPSSAGGAASSSQPSEPQPLLVQWLEVEDSEDDAFLAQIETYDVGAPWDHRAHLRYAWLNLTRHGRREGMKRIFAGIRGYIENSQRTFKTKYHETMTYFWIHMVHFAIEASKNPTGDFKGFLMMNPHLSNGGMFLDYYSKDLMFHNAQARVEVMLPDVKPLPSLLPAASGPSQGPSSSAAPALPKDWLLSCPDGEFLERLRSSALPSWSHQSLLRLVHLHFSQDPESPRSVVEKRIFEDARLVMGEHFHLTRVNFWLHMVDTKLQTDRAAASHSKASRDPSFASFLGRHSSITNPLLILDYYSVHVLNSPEAQQALILPNLRQFSSVISKK